MTDIYDEMPVVTGRGHKASLSTRVYSAGCGSNWTLSDAGGHK